MSLTHVNTRAREHATIRPIVIRAVPAIESCKAPCSTAESDPASIGRANGEIRTNITSQAVAQ